MYFATAWHDVFVNDAIADFERAESIAGRNNKLHIFKGNHIEYTKHLPRMLSSMLAFFDEAIRTTGAATTTSKESTASTTSSGGTLSSTETNDDEGEDNDNGAGEDGSGDGPKEEEQVANFTYDVYNGSQNEVWTHGRPGKPLETQEMTGCDDDGSSSSTTKLACARYYMDAGNKLSHRPCVNECHYHYDCDPKDPTPSCGGNALGHAASGRRSQHREVETRKDLVMFTSAPLEEPLQIRGSCEIEIHAESSDGLTAFVGEHVCCNKLVNSLLINTP